MKKAMQIGWRLLALFPLITLSVLLGCSSGDDGILNPVGGGQLSDADCSSNGTVSTIENNHGHELNVTPADIKAGESKIYAIQGSADHAHDVTVTPSDFDSLEDDSAIEVNSSTGGTDEHSHPIIIACAQG